MYTGERAAHQIPMEKSSSVQHFVFVQETISLGYTLQHRREDKLQLPFHTDLFTLYNTLYIVKYIVIAQSTLQLFDSINIDA